ncbi:MAG: hypothetical protein QXT19_04595 [Candidatus Woesearchaeota archaeon]
MEPDEKERIKYAIKELKEEYGIGSYDAWKYLMDERLFSQLKEQVNKELKKSNPRRFATTREVANIATQVKRYLDNFFEIKQPFVLREKEYVLVGSLEEYLQNQNGFLIKPYAKYSSHVEETDRTLELDYKEFIVDVFKKSFDNGNDTVTGFEFEEVLKDLLKGRKTYLYFKNKPFNIKEFLPVELCSSATKIVINNNYNSIDDNFIDEIKDKIYAIYEYSVLVNGDGVIDDLINFLTENYEYYNTDYEKEEFLPMAEFKSLNFREIPMHHMFLLGGFYGLDSYKRAVREKTLKNIDTQRRLALLNIYKMGLEDMPPNERIKHALDFYKDRIKKAKEYYDTFIRHGAKGIAEHQQEEIKMYEYLIRVTISNESWLKRILES